MNKINLQRLMTLFINGHEISLTVDLCSFKRIGKGMATSDTTGGDGDFCSVEKEAKTTKPKKRMTVVTYLSL